MEQKELLDVLAKIAGGVARTMGQDTEIAVHDLKAHTMSFIVNGHVTDRATGNTMPDSVYDMIMRQAEDGDYMIGYSGISSKGKNLRCSHIVIRDENGVPAAMICINQDNTRLEEFKNYLDHMLEARNPYEETARNEESLTDMAQKAIMNSMWKMTSADLNTKEGKIALIRDLKRQGIFQVKATMPFICKALSISQTTLYNYLREIKAEENGFADLKKY